MTQSNDHNFQPTRPKFGGRGRSRRQDFQAQREAPPNSARPNDNLLFASKIVVADKTLFVDLCANRRGHYLRIKERRGNASSTSLIPWEAFPEFVQALNGAMEAYNKAIAS